MRTFDFKERNILSGPHLLGTLLILTGLFALSSPFYTHGSASIERTLLVGMSAIIPGVFILTSYRGTYIDFTKQRFREYTAICGYRFGTWKPLPVIKQVKSMAQTHVQTNTPNGVSPTLSGKVTSYYAFLYSTSERPAFTFTYSKKEMATRQAKRLAKHLDAELFLED